MASHTERHRRRCLATKRTGRQCRDAPPQRSAWQRRGRYRAGRWRETSAGFFLQARTAPWRCRPTRQPAISLMRQWLCRSVRIDRGIIQKRSTAQSWSRCFQHVRERVADVLHRRTDACLSASRFHTPPEGPDVAALVCLASLRLLRRHVGRGAEEDHSPRRSSSRVIGDRRRCGQVRLKPDTTTIGVYHGASAFRRTGVVWRGRSPAAFTVPSGRNLWVFAGFRSRCTPTARAPLQKRASGQCRARSAAPPDRGVRTRPGRPRLAALFISFEITRPRPVP